jgi:signal transduction histidine kinase
VADPERIRQLIGNLLSNAVKFTPAGGRVTLSARDCGKEILVSVEDGGPGIPTEDLPHLFDRFWHARRTARVGGTGLGLNIAKGIVEAHGGRIWVETAEGVGSTFFFSLPHATAGPAVA